MISVNPSEAIPIWKQIEDEIRRLIALGVLEENDTVPSVRELARQLRVNPATVSKAYQQLMAQGILTVRRGEGTFVSSSIPQLRRQERRQLLNNAARRYTGLAVTIGSPEDEALGEIERAWDEINHEDRGSSR